MRMRRAILAGTVVATLLAVFALDLPHLRVALTTLALVVALGALLTLVVLRLRA
jgi:hypothetical protein